ncbi:hypothetical protein [Moorena producens]|uniref:hypothetical protein n=1 Tax=Moorena producens TaxID=1155739 RepID=UPI003C791E5D
MTCQKVCSSQRLWQGKSGFLTFNLPYGKAKGEQPSTVNLQPSTFNLQPSTFNLQPSTFNISYKL